MLRSQYLQKTSLVHKITNDRRTTTKMAEAIANVKSDAFVSLEPFVHQVSGHCCFMKFNDVSVCKPLNPREHRIYEDLPLELRPFTPEYRGKSIFCVCHVRRATSQQHTQNSFIQFRAFTRNKGKIICHIMYTDNHVCFRKAKNIESKRNTCVLVVG